MLELLVSVLLAGAPGDSADEVPAVDLAGADIIVAPGAPDPERFAARELSRYLRLLSGKASRIVDAPEPEARRRSPAIHLQAGWLPLRQLPEDCPTKEQAYSLSFRPPGSPVLRIGAWQPAGIPYGAYALLERLGVGFYLGGDALPERRDQLLVRADLLEVRAPVFRIRGTLPWYNFLNSPTTWDLEDYRSTFDQMAKMRCNFVGFHSYDSEPFCAYPWKGEWRMGAPAATSMTYGWGAVRHLRSDDFGFGTGRYFPHEVFGSRSAALARDPAPEARKPAFYPLRNAADDAIVRAQCVLAQGLDYARLRGLHVCLGFELTGDPTDAENRWQAEARIRNLLASYPMLDHVWFWQSEGLGGGSQEPGRDSALDLIVERHRPTFAYLGSDSRIAEAARVAAWVEFAHGIVRSFRPDIRVIVSGWGGDAWMRFSDFYVGLDRILPADVIFAALDNIDPTAQPHVSEAYGKLSPGREKWPIPWFESDGGGTRRDQWGPQTNVRPFTELVHDARRKGCQGLLAIHWQTRGVEEVAAWTSQYAWEPDLTYEEFYRRFAWKCFGDRNWPEMAGHLMLLESLGPRWTGGAGQVECGGFQWFSDDRRPREESLKLLGELDAAFARIEGGFRVGPGLRHLERLRYLRATIAFLVAFDRAAVDLAPGGRVARQVDAAEAAASAGRADEARGLAREALSSLEASSLGPAMAAYAERLTSQGDFGNLATINVKAWAAWRGLWERAAAALGETEPKPVPPALAAPPASLGVPDDAPRLVVKSPPTAVPEGVPLVVRGVAFDEGGSPVEVRLRWRTPGAAEWTERSMAPAERNLFVAEIPGDDVGAEGLEYWVEASASGGGRTSAPVGYPELIFTATALPGSRTTVGGPWLQGDMAMASWGSAGTYPSRPASEGEAGMPQELPEGSPPARSGAAPTHVRATVISPREYEGFEATVSEDGEAFGTSRSAYHLAAIPVPADRLDRRELGCAIAAADGEGRLTPGGEARFFATVPGRSARDVRAEIAGPFHVRVRWEAAAFVYSDAFDLGDGVRSEHVRHDVARDVGPVLYEVHRSSAPGFAPGPETLLARWPWTVYDDVGVQPLSRYEYAIVTVGEPGHRAPAARSGVLEVGDFPLPAPPSGVRARAGFGRVTLEWEAPEEAVSGFAVFRLAGDAWTRIGGDQPIAGKGFVASGLPEAKPCRFVVRSVDRAGRLGEASLEVAATPLAVPVGPVFEASFAGTKAESGPEGRLGGKAKTGGVLDLSEGGWIAYPGSELLQVSGPLSIELWANVDRIEGIPVLLSFGHWEGPGYWLQLIGGAIRFYLPVEKILDAGTLPTGGWHHIAAAYDGTTSRLYVDGKEAGSAAVGHISLEPWPGELRIGIYSDVDPQFQTLGRIDDVRIFQRALGADEVRRSFESGRTER